MPGSQEEMAERGTKRGGCTTRRLRCRPLACLVVRGQRNVSSDVAYYDGHGCRLKPPLKTGGGPQSTLPSRHKLCVITWEDGPRSWSSGRDGLTV